MISCGNTVSEVKATLKRWWITARGPVFAWFVLAVVLIIKRPLEVPVVANLDSAHEVLDAWLQFQQGLEVRGHFSYAMLTFHPGPMYLWTLVAGGGIASALLGSPWFAYGAWIGVLAVLAVSYTVAWVALRRVFGVTAANAALIPLLLVPALIGPGDWFGRALLGQQLWGVCLEAGLASAAVASAVAFFSGYKFWAAPAAFFAGLLAQQHDFTLPVGGVVMCFVLFLVCRAAMRTRGSLLAFMVASVAGWWWLPYRIVVDGLTFFVPEPEGHSLQPGHWPSHPVISTYWGLRALGTHTMLPWFLAPVAVLGVVALLVRFREPIGRPITLLLSVLLTIGVLEQVFAWPQEYSAYQTSWFEPLWYGALTVGFVFWMKRSGRLKETVLRRGVAGFLMLSAVAVVAHPSTLDYRIALWDREDPPPVEQFERVADLARQYSLPVVISVDMDPERNSPVYLYLVQRGISTCITGAVTPPRVTQPLQRIVCSDIALEQRAVWVTTASGSPSKPPFAATAYSWPGSFRWASDWATWIPAEEPNPSAS